MATRELTIRFYLACHAPGNFVWPPQRSLHDMLRAALPRTGAAGVWVDHHPDRFLIENTTRSKGRMHLVVTRDLDAVPAIRHGANTRALQLATGDVPASSTHIIYLPAGVVAVVRSSTSPSPAQAAGAVATHSQVPVQLLALQRDDQTTVLNNTGGVTSMELRVVNLSPDLRRRNDIFSAIEDLNARQGYRVTISIVALTDVERRALRAQAVDLAAAISDGEANVEIARANVQGIAGAPARVVDLLEDDIVVKWKVQLSQTANGLATLSPREVYDAVVTAYNEMRVHPIGAALQDATPDFPNEP